MKKYKAVIKTTQEWTKDIKIPDDVEDIRDYATKYFDEWLNNCPCEHIIIKPSMNTKDNTIVIEFDFMRAVEVD